MCCAGERQRACQRRGARHPSPSPWTGCGVAGKSTPRLRWRWPVKTERRLVVIGGGFGGLASAIRLQAAGQQVTLVEARGRVGGRAYQLQEGGFTFDMGPSLITAPDLLRDLWATAGRQLEEDVHLAPLRRPE